MTEGCGYDPEWWKADAAASLERKKAAADATKAAKRGDTFLIVTEGKVTEPIYFELLTRELQLHAVHVRIIPGKAPDPKRVIETASREAKSQRTRHRTGRLSTNGPARFDHVWAVIDTDVAERTSCWSELKELAKKLDVRVAHSTPCIEFWLLLHLSYTTKPLLDGGAAKCAVQERLKGAYSTNEETTKAAMRTLVPQWPAAVGHAGRVRQHHQQARTTEPANPSTDVDLLVRALNDSASEHVRKTDLPPDFRTV